MTDSKRDIDDDTQAGESATEPDDGSVGDGDAAGDRADLSPTGGPDDAEDSSARSNGGQETRRAAGADADGRDLADYVEWAAFGLLCLLAVVATFRFYFAASEAIRVWFSPDFVPVFQAVFNLVVLVASAAGISILVRRIS